MVTLRNASPLESEASTGSYDSITASEASTMSTEPAVDLDDLDIDALLAAAKESQKTKKVAAPQTKMNGEKVDFDSISFDNDEEEESDDEEEGKNNKEEDNEHPTLKKVKDTISRIPKLTDMESAFTSKSTRSSIPKTSSNRDNLTFRNISDPVLLKRAAKEKRESTAGEKWFNMPKAEMTPELKRDLQLLQMRNVLDPKRHYKKNTFGISNKDGEETENGGFPKFIQKGTIVEDSSEFFSARLTRKQRKQTFAQEVLSDDKTKTYFKRKYGEIMQEKNNFRSTRRRKY